MLIPTYGSRIYSNVSLSEASKPMAFVKIGGVKKQINLAVIKK